MYSGLEGKNLQLLTKGEAVEGEGEMEWKAWNGDRGGRERKKEKRTIILLLGLSDNYFFTSK